MNNIIENFGKNPNAAKRGFTLIELLIVIAIIAILSSLLMVNFIGVRQRARDAQRKSDMRQIQTALELYRSDQGSYPTGNTLDNCSGAFGAPGCEQKSIYLQKIPKDPLGGGYNNGNYYFNGPDSSTYTLAGCLENKNDNDQNDSATSPGGSGCPSGQKYYVLHQP